MNLIRQDAKENDQNAIAPMRKTPKGRMTRGERRRRARRAARRRKASARIKMLQGYAVYDPDIYADGRFRSNGFLCRHYGSMRRKRNARQWFASRYWKNRPHFELKGKDYCRNERRQRESMDEAEEEYYGRTKTI